MNQNSKIGFEVNLLVFQIQNSKQSTHDSNSKKGHNTPNERTNVYERKEFNVRIQIPV